MHFNIICCEILQIAGPLGQKCIFFILLLSLGIWRNISKYLYSAPEELSNDTWIMTIQHLPQIWRVKTSSVPLIFWQTLGQDKVALGGSVKVAYSSFCLFLGRMFFINYYLLHIFLCMYECGSTNLHGVHRLLASWVHVAKLLSLVRYR